ncbi:MAG: HAD-IA family hydrolase [Schaedlerella sp.]|nr:HAD-IA family hydrolase [Schaedlerella sp.]
MSIHTILFDLDGTLTDSGEGIINSVEYTLKKYGFEVEDREQLRSFVGPPLAAQFSKYCGFSKEEGHRAVDVYREYYQVKGIFENTVYDGILDVLKDLKDRGYQICMATSKPEKFAKIIAEHFGFAQYFDVIAGSLMDGGRVNKDEVIEYVLDACGVTDRDTVLMVGDRCYDINGAKKAGTHSMGVLFGYGSREELEEAGAELIAETPEDIARLIK